MRLLSAIPSPVLTITATGFVATVAQIIILRELLVLFYGNELSAGLIFAGWLLWSGLGSGLSGKWALKVSAHTTLLRLMLVCLSAMLPLSVLFIRATRIIWTLPAGELPSIGKMLLISVAATGLFCPVSGALFGICWAIHRKKGENQPLGIYLGESLGSAAGGLIFYFVFLPYGSVFTTIWITSGMILFISWWLFRPWRPILNVRFEHLMWIAVSLLVVCGAVSGSRLDHMSRRWQWGPNLSAVYDTAYHNIALLKKEGQVSVFTNGLWLFSEPDRLSAEHGVHLALLQHPNPKTILLLGGGIAGLLKELFKHPGIRHIDYVEPDPDFIRLLKPHLSPATDASLQHPRVRLFHQDPRIFMSRSHAGYDVILMNMGDPITAQMNRFYTKEFFDQVKQRLLSSGVFSFAVSGGESMLGPTQARFLGTIKKTLLQIFPKTLIYPGDQTRFFATDISGVLLSDYSALANRIFERNLQLIYIREDILQNTLSPFRLDYLKSVLEGTTGVAVNKDFSPICYFHNLMMWASQWHEVLQKFLNILVDLKFRLFWAGLAIAGVIIVTIFWTGRSKFRGAVSGSIFVSGAIEMVLQVIFLLPAGNQCCSGTFYSSPGAGLYAPFRVDAIFTADSWRNAEFVVSGGNGLAVFRSQFDHRYSGRCSFCLGSHGYGRYRSCFGENRWKILCTRSRRGCCRCSLCRFIHTPDLRYHEYSGFSKHLVRNQSVDTSAEALRLVLSRSRRFPNAEDGPPTILTLPII
jgi:spermidine synthase